MVLFERFAPTLIAEIERALGRADDVGEQDCREHPVTLVRVPDARDELLDLVDDRVHVSHPWVVGVAGQLDVLRARDVLGEIAAVLDPDCPIISPMEDERGDVDRREDAAHVDLGVHPYELHQGARAAGGPVVPRLETDPLWVVCEGGRQDGKILPGLLLGPVDLADPVGERV